MGTTDRRFLGSDERGSIIAVTDGTGNLLATNSYDEYGIPKTTTPGLDVTGRFGYTGQAWLPELGMQYSKNRIYSPTLGRFLQTDPIGMNGGINIYAYVGNDPINFIDPLGLRIVCVSGPATTSGNVIPGSEVRTCGDNSGGGIDGQFHGLIGFGSGGMGFGGGFEGGGGIGGGGAGPGPVVVVALAPRPTLATKPSLDCPVNNNTLLGDIAREAGEISGSTAGLALASAAVGLATSETIVGGLTFGSIATGLGVISIAAASVQILAEAFDGNSSASRNHLLGTATGTGTAIALSQTAGKLGGPGARFASQVAGEIADGAITAAACGN